MVIGGGLKCRRYKVSLSCAGMGVFVSKRVRMPDKVATDFLPGVLAQSWNWDAVV